MTTPVISPQRLGKEVSVIDIDDRQVTASALESAVWGRNTVT